MVSLNYGDYFEEFRTIWLNEKLSLYHFAIKYLPGIDYATVVYEFKAIKAMLTAKGEDVSDIPPFSKRELGTLPKKNKTCSRFIATPPKAPSKVVEQFSYRPRSKNADDEVVVITSLPDKSSQETSQVATSNPVKTEVPSNNDALNIKAEVLGATFTLSDEKSLKAFLKAIKEQSLA